MHGRGRAASLPPAGVAGSSRSRSSSSSRERAIARDVVVDDPAGGRQACTHHGTAMAKAARPTATGRMAGLVRGTHGHQSKAKGLIGWLYHPPSRLPWCDLDPFGCLLWIASLARRVQKGSSSLARGMR